MTRQASWRFWPSERTSVAMRIRVCLSTGYNLIFSFDSGEKHQACAAGFSESPVAQSTLSMPVAFSAPSRYFAVSANWVKIRNFSSGCCLLTSWISDWSLKSFECGIWPVCWSMRWSASASVRRCAFNVFLNMSVRSQLKRFLYCVESYWYSVCASVA